MLLVDLEVHEEMKNNYQVQKKTPLVGIKSMN